MNEDKTNLGKAKVNEETSQIAWKDLQRFFAGGTIIYVAPELDLVDVAFQMSIIKRRSNNG